MEISSEFWLTTVLTLVVSFIGTLIGVVFTLWASGKSDRFSKELVDNRNHTELIQKLETTLKDTSTLKREMKYIRGRVESFENTIPAQTHSELIEMLKYSLGSNPSSDTRSNAKVSS